MYSFFLHALRSTPALVAVMVTMAMQIPAHAQFALAVSPPRFELQAKPGDRLREVIELSNSEPQASEYGVKTADWIFEKDASVTLVDDLLPNTCRPWVAIERRQVNVGPNQTYRYRFEIAVPANAPTQECRFAVAIQGKEQTVRQAGLPIPVSARMAVVVYLAVGDAKPQLSLVSATTRAVSNIKTAALLIKNSGNAHGRLEGVLTGVDANGVELEFTPASTPIMPGETREITLGASRFGASDAPVSVRFPVKVSGKLEWGKNQAITLVQLFEP